MPKVLISTSTFAEGDAAPVKKLEGAGFAVTLNPFKRKLTKPESLQLLPQFDGLIAGLEVLDEEVLKNSKLKVISRVGAGISNVDVEAAKRLNIKVASTPDAPTLAVAELTLGMMLALLRQVPAMDQALHRKEWAKKMGQQLSGKKVAIIGFGRIGRKVAQLLGPFDTQIMVVDPFVKDNKVFPLKEVLPQADIITIHVSGETQLIGSEEFKLMKNGIFILNASRGEVINESSLIEALKEKKVAGGWCDVFHQEPYSGALCDFPQMILTPHIASNTKECRQLMEMQAVENLIEAFKS
jgi:D-3-phosphoglycerate dehydrogenase